MEEVIYARISSKGQNEDRQLKEGVKDFTDTCSGSVPFMEREYAQKLISYLQKNPNTKTIVNSISRLGRSTSDVLETIKYFNKHNYKIEFSDVGVQADTPMGRMVITMMSAVHEMELENIRENQRQGIAVAKAKGKYKGRVKGAIMTKERTLKKHFDIVNCFESGWSVNKASLTTKKNRATCKKVYDVLKNSNKYRQTNIIEQIEEQENK